MTAQRLLYLTMAGLILTGIYLTGGNAVHWSLYLPALMLIFAGITGNCPGLNVYKKLGFK